MRTPRLPLRKPLTHLLSLSPIPTFARTLNDLFFLSQSPPDDPLPHLTLTFWRRERCNSCTKGLGGAEGPEVGSRGGQSPGLPWLIAAGGGGKEGAPASARPPASLSRAAAAGCSKAAAALWTRPRLVWGAEGRGAGGAARLALSGSWPRGGASSARELQLLRACCRTRSPSSHCSAAAGCFEACGMLSGLALRAFLSEDPAAASLQATS